MNFKSIHEAAKILGQVPKTIIIICLEKNIPLYVNIASRSNRFTICDDYNGALKVMSGPEYMEERMASDEHGNEIIQFISNSKAQITSGYEAIRTEDLKQLLNSGTVKTLAFKDIVVGNVRYIKNYLTISIDDLFIVDSDVLRLKGKYILREQLEDRHARWLGIGTALHASGCKYKDITKMITDEENILRQKSGLPNIAVATVTKELRRSEIVKNAIQINKVDK